MAGFSNIIFVKSPSFQSFLALYITLSLNFERKNKNTKTKEKEKYKNNERNKRGQIVKQ